MRRRSGRLMVRRALGAAMLALAAGSPVPAAAQPDESLPVRRTRLLIAGALNDVLEHAPSYRDIPWTDPSGRSAGAITVYSPIMQGGRPCRNFRYVARDGSEEITGTGLRCREPDGLWLAAGTLDIVAARPLAPTVLAPPFAMPGPPPPDPLLAQLQTNLMRLAYDGGPADGLMRPGFEDAVRSFEADEGVPPGLNFIRRDLALSAAAVIRTQTTGSCEPLAAVQAATLVCGRRR